MPAPSDDPEIIISQIRRGLRLEFINPQPLFTWWHQRYLPSQQALLEIKRLLPKSLPVTIIGASTFYAYQSEYYSTHRNVQPFDVGSTILNVDNTLKLRPSLFQLIPDGERLSVTYALFTTQADRRWLKKLFLLSLGRL